MKVCMIIKISVITFLTHLGASTLINQRMFKKVSFSGNSWTKMVYRTVLLPTQNLIDCLGQCQSDSMNCNICFFDETHKSCWLGNLAQNLTLVTSNSDVNGFVDLGFVKNQMTTQTVSVQSLNISMWQGNIYKNVAITNPDPEWDCSTLCLNVDVGLCIFFVIEGGVCYLGQSELVNGSVATQSPIVTYYTTSASVLSRSQNVTSIAGSVWSSNIYFQTPKFGGTLACASLCQLPSTPTCHYYVFASGICYLGNAFVKQSSIAVRSDVQTVALMAGSTFFTLQSNVNAWTNAIIRIVPGVTSDAACMLSCIFALDCHYVIYVASTGCLIGNFKQTPISVSVTGTLTTHIFKDRVRTDNVPDSNHYVNKTTANTDWSTKIVQTVTSIPSEGLCSSICSLSYPNCEFFVYTDNALACHLGLFAAVISGVWVNPTGSDIARTRILYDFNVASGRGTSEFASTCPPGFNLLSCGIANSVFNGHEAYRLYYPSDSTSCMCRDYFGAACVAYCTTLPVVGFQIAMATGSGLFSATCPAGTNTLGCHISPYTYGGVDDWRYTVPKQDQQSCQCKDDNGASCYATCGSGIKDYEIASVWGTSYVTVTCSISTNVVLGCGSNPNGATQVEGYRSVRVHDQRSCICYDYFGTMCFAICGKLQ